MTSERTRRVLGALRELKIQVGDEVHGATDVEHGVLQDIFVRLAQVGKRLEDSPDDAAALQIEVEQARVLVVEQRDLLQRRYLNIVNPPWQVPASRDANLIFYSGPEAGRQIAAELVQSLRGELNPSVYTSDAAPARWRDLRAAGSAIFDLSGLAAQVHYDLGVALALGTHAVILAEEGTQAPFDIGQDVILYGKGAIGEVLPAAMERALYGAVEAGDPQSSVDAAVDHARGLAAKSGAPLGMTIFSELPDSGCDPVQAHSLLRLLGPMVPQQNLMLTRSRWPAVFPGEQRRCFVIMPFREQLKSTWETIQQASNGTGVEVERGDQAAGQEIIRSIWAEIGRSTDVIVDLTGVNPNVCIELGIADTLGKQALLIGAAGIEDGLAQSFPSLAKRRCHPYGSSDELQPILKRFFAGELSWR